MAVKMTKSFCLLLLKFLFYCEILQTALGSTDEPTVSPGDVNGYFLDSLLVNYDGRVRPNFGKESVLVNISLQVASIGHIAESTMDYRVTVFLRQLWNDPRLQFTDGSEPVNVDVSLLKSLWVPDLFVVNEKSANFHSVTKDNKLLRISPTGDVLLSQRLSLTLACNMKLHRFPMDQQICKIQLESYAFTTRDIDFKWAEGIAMNIEESVELPQFFIQSYWTEICTRMYSTGEYPCVEALIKLQRQTGYYIIQTYIPTLLIVCLSWISFWIDATASTARVALGITTVLTMTTQTSSAQESLPKVSYIKAIDIWMAVCLLFVFSALLEFSAVNYMARWNEKRLQKKQEKKQAADKLLEDEQEAAGESSFANGVPIFENQSHHNSKPEMFREKASSSGFLSGLISRKTGRRTIKNDVEQYIACNNNLHDYPETTLEIEHSKNVVDEEFSDADENDQAIEQKCQDLKKVEANKVVNQSEQSSDLSVRVDEFSRIAFPVAFISFNVVYWCTFMR
ncbi:glycine receptor subunit alpha-4-like [Symsagittifera roscoffensis]|uniref:glycine receptor subunit alpha-4-like n=1 Tax=Symsagittifera roscoffensis TaxID=84072 RepID=UPI00307BDADC